MGRRGPKPLPAAIKRLRGSRRTNNTEPTPATATPEPPEHLTPAALEEWNRITPELEALGLLAVIDLAALSVYCTAWARWTEAERKIRETGGEVVKSPSGYPILSPWLSVSRAAARQLEAFIKEFGLSPSARTRVHVETTKPSTQDNKYLKIV